MQNTFKTDYHLFQDQKIIHFEEILHEIDQLNALIEIEKEAYLEEQN